MSWTTYEEYRHQLAEQHALLQQISLATRAPPQDVVDDADDGYASKSKHLRRTLDQYYYPALSDTSARDVDQTISKWSDRHVPANGRTKAADDSLLVMVDQLWCWVVDESPSSASLYY
jgi:hypothetical protein